MVCSYEELLHVFSVFNFVGEINHLKRYLLQSTEFQTRVERSCEMDATPRIVHFLVFVLS